MTDDTEPLLQAPLPQTQRRSGRKVGLVALALGSLLLLGLYLTLTARQRQREAPRPTPKPNAYEVTSTPDASATLDMQKDYTKRALWNPEPPPPPKPSQGPVPPPPIERPPPVPMFPPVMQAAALLPPLPPAPTPLPAALPPAPPPAQKAVEVVQAPTPQAKDPKKPTSWMKGEVHLAKPPFEVKDSKEKPNTPGKEEKGASALLREAAWIRPADPTRVLYRTQAIHGQLLRAVNSDVPGDIYVLVTRPVYDTLGQGRTLIPQHAELIGTQQGKTTYGTRRLDVSIVEIKFPDGTLVPLNKAKLTDKSGAVGGAGDVDNHYTQLGVAAVLSAVLNVGARSLAGNQGGFAPTLEQQTASDIGGSINRSGQSIVDRELKVPPTISLKAGETIAVQLSENISFAKPPKIVQ
jgi:type IV secretory pathway VirB10-like protein